MRLLAIGVLSLIPLVAQTPPVTAQDWMKEGEEARHNGRFPEAAAAFEHAVTLDPRNEDALLQLSAAYASQYRTGPDGADNLNFAHQADTTLRAVLELNPSSKPALAALASLHYRMREYDDAKSWYKRLLQVDPSNKDALFSLGLIASDLTRPEIRTARMNLKMQQQDPGPLSDGNLRYTLREKYSATITEGITSLESALRMDPNFAKALIYLNQLYRLRADIEDTAAASAQDVATAEDYQRRSLKLAPGASSPGSAPVTPQRIRVGGNVQAANLIHNVPPVYPPLAMQARVQGTVRFTVIIAKEGTVSNVQLVSGHPLLVQAAVDAVKQYLYKPTLLNGQPIEVATQVDVNFTLDQ